MRSCRALLSLVVTIPLAAACGSGGPSPSAAPEPGAPIACHAPIGPVQREDCSEVAKEFDVLSVSGALKVAAVGRDADSRLDALKSAGALAESLKEQRVELCEASNKCQIARRDHDAEDARLTEGMRALLDLWTHRHLESQDEVAKFKGAVASLSNKINPPKAEPPPPPSAFTVDASQALAKTDDPLVAFRPDGAAITVSTDDAKVHDALAAASDKLSLPAGKHVQLKVVGTYAPATPALIGPGDEIAIKFKVHALEAGDIAVGLRSIEDPSSNDLMQTIHVEKGDKGDKSVTVTASSIESGFEVVVAPKAEIAIDDIEASRGGKLVVAARAEGDEATVASTCAIDKKKPIAGKASFHCAAAASPQEIALGVPPAHLVLALKSGGGDVVTFDTLSLDGGRTLDAKLAANSQFVVRLAGPGKATIRSIELTEVK